MDVLIVTTESHRELSRAFFTPTMPPTAGAVVKEKQLDVAGAGDFESESWQSAVTAKLRWVSEYLGTVEDNTVFVLSDVDIQFFDTFTTDALRAELDRAGVDVLFQKEHRSPQSTEVNTGFYVARKTEWLTCLVQAAIDLCDGSDVKNDQTAINALLRTDDLGTRWGFLPLQYYARSQGFPPIGEIVLHHANFSGSVTDKLAQLQRVRAYVTGGRSDRVKATIAEAWDYATSGKLRTRVRVLVKGR